MEEQVDRLANKLWHNHSSTPSTSRYLVAISGIPGSGKTSLAAAVAQRLNQLSQLDQRSTTTTTLNDLPIATTLSMDGYHLTRAQLAAMPDPAHAFARRGAPFTFDPLKLLTLIKELRQPLTPSSRTIYAPSFDHAVKDPVENAIAIPPTVRIVLIEGNYLSLAREPWSEIAGLMDEGWFVEVGVEVARERLVSRHVAAGIERENGVQKAEKRSRRTSRSRSQGKERDERGKRVTEARPAGR